MSTNKVELVELGGYGAIAADDESANDLLWFCFVSVIYILQEDMESDGNQLTSGDLFFNDIYISRST